MPTFIAARRNSLTSGVTITVDPTTASWLANVMIDTRRTDSTIRGQERAQTLLRALNDALDG